MRICALVFLLFAAACGSNSSADKNTELPPSPAPPVTNVTDSPEASSPEEKRDEDESSALPPPTSIKSVPTRPDENHSGLAASTEFVDIKELDPSIKIDIRYATTNNFTKSKIYDCPRCLLRKEAADAIIKAQQALKRKGLGLKMFDCYRPRPYQQRLWDKVPNPDYVTPPAKGSMHSRGAAVDLTLVNAQGDELDMGTPYDFFGREAHTDITDLPQQVLANRRLLRETLGTYGFKGIRTEWWHFSFQGKNWPLSDYIWPCDK